VRSLRTALLLCRPSGGGVWNVVHSTHAEYAAATPVSTMMAGRYRETDVGTEPVMAEAEGAEVETETETETDDWDK